MGAQAALETFLADEGCWAMSLSGAGAVYRLEQRYASLVGVPHALAVANATLGLWALFLALEIHGSEVITTPYTWGGSLAGLILAGNRPVFADINRETLNLDPESVRSRITPKTRAVLAVDIYGHPCEGPALRRIADEHGLVLLQDCAQSFGAFLGEHHTGWWADAAVFSLGWGKALFAGEGGVVVTRHQELLNRLVWATQHPLRQLRDVPDRPVNELALNLRLHSVSAVWADASFEDALAFVARRREASQKVLAVLGGEGMSKTKPPDGVGVRSSFHRLTFEPTGDPSALEALLSRRGRGCRLCRPPIVEPIYRQAAYTELALSHRWPRPKRCRVAEEQGRLRRSLAPLKFSEAPHISPSEMMGPR